MLNNYTSWTPLAQHMWTQNLNYWLPDARKTGTIILLIITLKKRYTINQSFWSAGSFTVNQTASCDVNDIRIKSLCQIKWKLLRLMSSLDLPKIISQDLHTGFSTEVQHSICLDNLFCLFSVVSIHGFFGLC